jgi:hypothetical protein
MKLVSTIVCEDVLANPAGRLTLYNLFQDLEATSFPASLPRLHVVSTWHNPGESSAQALVRVVVLAPDESLVGDAVATVSAAAGAYHTHISRFRELVLPSPGTYRVQIVHADQVVSDLPLAVIEPGKASIGVGG